MDSVAVYIGYIIDYAAMYLLLWLEDVPRLFHLKPDISTPAQPQQCFPLSLHTSVTLLGQDTKSPRAGGCTSVSDRFPPEPHRDRAVVLAQEASTLDAVHIQWRGKVAIPTGSSSFLPLWSSPG